MKKIFFSTVCFLALLFITIANAVDVKVGLWEVTSQIDMPGMAFQMPPVTQTQCITEDDLVPKSTNAGEQCTVDSHGINSNTVTWQVSCQTDAGDMTGNGRITYQGDTFSGGFTMDIDGPQGRMQMKNKMEGRRIGDC